MSYNLFLDDIRKPEHAYIYPKRDGSGLIIDARSLKRCSGVDDADWIVVRDYNSFVDTIEERGLPDVVSFDHDLHEEHINHYFNVTQDTGVIEYANLKEKTGKHCAEVFIEKCKQLQPQKLPDVYVHSANKYGAIEIKRVLEQLYD
jgi:hypothetical protein